MRNCSTAAAGVYGARMSDLTSRFDRAQQHFGGLVHEIGDDQWTAPTPCSDWDVRALVNHLVYEARWAVPLLEGQTIEQVGDRFDGDLLGEDPKRAYDEALAATSAALAEPGALDRTVHLSYGETPAAGYLTQLAGDFVIHGWDLARALGADETIDPDLVDWVYAEAEPQADMLAASGLFGARLDVPADADAQTTLLALFGRRA
jgi:uncharacterized protein (TIGR03086 family)